MRIRCSSALFFLVALVVLIFADLSRACDLCAIYRATNARGESASGFLFTASEQFTASRTFQFEGEPYTANPFFAQAYLNSSLTHIVPTYNFSEQFGVSLNIPLIYRSFHLIQLEAVPPFGIEDEIGTLFGLGDMSLIGRWTPLRISEMQYSIIGSVFAGAKFPTGNTDRLDIEIEQEREAQALFGPGHNHPIGGIHQHDLTLGSGSFDGVFGGALTGRYGRWFLSGQGQYYLRTLANGYKFGDEIMISGGPGAYLLLNKKFTLTLQANAVYDTMAEDEIFGVNNNQSGWTAWYFGPLVSLTWLDHLTANVGVDIPLRIYNHGFQTVPDYRIHGGVSWRF